MAESGVIPSSDALDEAKPESLNELFSRDPEGFSEQDLDKIVVNLRKQRERWAAMEREKGAGSKAKAAPKKGLSLETTVAAKDLDL